MRRRRRLAGLIAAAALTLGVSAPAALATGSCPPPPVKHCKPGYGFGDKNHCHFGPPGLGYSNTNPYN